MFYLTMHWTHFIYGYMVKPIQTEDTGCRYWSGQVRSGQFNVHIQSKLLYRMSVTGTGTGLRLFLCPGQEKWWWGVGGTMECLHWRVQGSTSSPTEFGMSRRIKPKEKYVRISMKDIWRSLDGPSKNKNCGAT